MTQTSKSFTTEERAEYIRIRRSKILQRLNNLDPQMPGWQRLKEQLLLTPSYREQYKKEGDELFKRLHGSVLGME